MALIKSALLKIKNIRIGCESRKINNILFEYFTYGVICMGKNNKYKNENSIVSQERHDEIKQQIMQLLENPVDKAHRALGEDEIAVALGISGYEAGEMMTCIDELVNVADIIRNRKGKYRIPEEGSVLTGRIQTTAWIWLSDTGRWQRGCVYTARRYAKCDERRQAAC